MDYKKLEAALEALKIEPERKYDIVWKIAIGMVLVHVAGLYGLYYFVVNAKFVTMFYGYWVFILSGAGITVGAHRYFTHRTFKMNQVLRFIFMLLFTMSGENDLYIWVRDHRQHHKYSDTDADPHNAKRGFFFSHVGWIMVRKHPEVKAKMKTLDLSDIENDPIIKFHKKEIQPLENEFVSLITYGEGWHNFHHMFPYDYRASEFGRRHDLGTRTIEWLKRHGYAYDLRETPQHLVDKWVRKFGDGTPTARKELQTIQYHESNDDECTKDERFASRRQEESATA
ncbi:acyl-CoA Delta(11) desaturase-like isoform X1 [Periplaneta americana]|uniref:acyl-CoA Delta(11) desaturase-like isoform X1 n=1 Tax=Periplaneta americana TaxID=6978 RepID=UPI0037E8737A